MALALEVYKQFEERVKNGSLEIKGNHHTDADVFFKHDQEKFLKEMQRGFINMYFTPEDGIATYNICKKCGESIAYRFKNNALEPIQSECFELNGNPIFEISVPSGELLFVDWFRSEPGVLKKDEYSLNLSSIKGIVGMTNHYAENNIGHFYTMNTSPLIYQKGNELFIGRPATNELFLKGTEEMGKVITDLWWVTFIDKAIFEKIAIKELGEKKGKQFVNRLVKEAHVIVKVEPGMYQFEYFYENPGYEKLYATIKKCE